MLINIRLIYHLDVSKLVFNRAYEVKFHAHILMVYQMTFIIVLIYSHVCP